MRISSKIYKFPEEVIQDVVGSQKTIRTTRLADLLLPVIEKMKWQEEKLKDNVKSIRSLNDRAQKAEEELRILRGEVRVR